MSAFIDRLKQAMQSKCVRQTDVAADTGIPKAAISNYLAGRYEPTGKRLYTLADYFNVSPAWLKGYTNTPNDGDISEKPLDKEHVNQYLGRRIKQIREARGISMTELAGMVDTTKQNIYKYENGIVQNMPIATLIRLADIFGVTVDYLVGHDTLTANTYKVKITKKRG